MTTIDWNTLYASAQTHSFEPVPQGVYDVVCITSEAKQTSNGKPMVSARFEVESGPLAGRKIWNNFVVSPESPAALSFFFQHMGVLGLDQTYFAQSPSLDHVAAALNGRRCRMTVSIESRGGQQRQKVDSIEPPGPVSNGPQIDMSQQVQQPVAAPPAPSFAQPPQAQPQQPVPAPVQYQPQPQPQPQEQYQQPVQQPQPQEYQQPQQPAQAPQPPQQQPPQQAAAPVQYQAPAAPPGAATDPPF